MSAINITKNPVKRLRTKHIKVRHHFIRDHTRKVISFLNLFLHIC